MAGMETKQDLKSKAQSKPGATPDFTMTDEMKEFAEILAVIRGQPVVLETPEEQRFFQVEFNVWKGKGKPRPTLGPQVEQPELPIPLKIYRIKVLGIQYLFWRDTKNQIHDREVAQEKEITEDPATHVKSEKVISERPKYVTRFNKEGAEKLVEDSQARCHQPQYYLIDTDGKKYSVGPGDFSAGDFDKMILAHRQRRYEFQ